MNKFQTGSLRLYFYINKKKSRLYCILYIGSYKVKTNQTMTKSKREEKEKRFNLPLIQSKINVKYLYYIYSGYILTK